MARKKRPSPTPSRPRAAAPEEKAPDFTVEYQYVISDLKRFGLIAVAMFVLLVLLALVV